MIGALVFVVIVTSVTVFGNKTTEKMAMVSDSVSSAIGD